MAVDVRRLGRWLMLAPIGASLCSGVAFGVAHWAFGLGDPNPSLWRFNPSPLSILQMGFALGVIGSVFAAVANCTLGVVWQLVADRFSLRSPALHIAAGAISAFAFTTLLLWEPLSSMARDGGDFVETAPLYSWAVLTGAITALFAWLIRQPDRNATNLPRSTT